METEFCNPGGGALSPPPLLFQHMSRKSYAAVSKRIEAFLADRPELAKKLAAEVVEYLMLDDAYDLRPDENDPVDGADFTARMSEALFGCDAGTSFHDLFAALSPPPKHKVDLRYTLRYRRADKEVVTRSVPVPSLRKNVLRHFLLARHPSGVCIDEDSIDILGPDSRRKNRLDP